MSPARRALAHLVIAAAVAFHLYAVFGEAWVLVALKPSKGRDFATYYYAVQVAADGGNPYARGSMARFARSQGEPRAVHPFLYPPPFLLLMLWAVPMSLVSAYQTWFWLDELFAAAAFFALWRWWRPLGPAVGVALALAVAAFTAVPANHIMGQANFPGLALALLGLWLDDRKRPVVGGILVGAACMLKMSPALFVAWWLMKRNWVAALSACLTAVALTLAVLPLADPAVQLSFYTQVLPTFGSGEYNGLRVPIGHSEVGRPLFGNHSLPSIYHQIWPGTHRVLSRTAQWASLLSTLVLVLGLGWLFRHRGGDALQRGSQVAAIAIAMLLVPVYTYEHHCVWALPAVVIAVVALVHGRLSPRWSIPLALACTAWAVEVSDLRALSEAVAPTVPALAVLIQELKFGALVVLLAATSVAGSGPPERYDADHAPRQPAV